MTVTALNQQRMTENNSVHDDGSASDHKVASTSTSNNIVPSVNIYSAKNVIKSTGNGTFTNGGGIPRIIPRGTKAPFLSIGSKNKECIDLLNSKEHKIDELKSCHSVNEIKFGNDISDKTVLIFDLTTNGFLLSPAAAKQSSKLDDNCNVNGDGGSDNDDEDCLCSNGGEVYRIHLSLPSTLVKRPKFDFEKLLQTVIDDSKRLKLINLIENCSTFLFYDGSSKITNCCISTFYLVKKFSDFLHGKLGKNQIRLFILERMDKSAIKNLENENQTENKSVTPKNSSTAYPPKKLNLSIKILPKTTDKMFIQSIKKDTVHYSPNSLKKFFKFHVPSEIQANDEILPSWLRPFSNKDGADIILQKLLANFEFLENLELKRLEKGLTTETRNNSYNNEDFADMNTSKSDRNLQDSSSYHKIYSLSNLQREFRKQKKTTSSKQSNASESQTNAASPTEPVSNLRLCIPPPSSIGTSNGGVVGNNYNNSNGNKIDFNHLSPHVDTDSSESLLTPMDSYEMSQGIQAFTKNRYSNILPYEHSRVKLQPSPIGGTAGDDNTHSRKNSYVEENHKIANKTNTISNNVHHPLSHSHSIKAHNNSTFPSITLQTPGQEPDEKLSNNTRKRRSSSLSYFNQSQNRNASISSYSGMENKNRNDENSGNFNDYFNANYLRIPQVNADFNYIATQAPLPSTVDDFWKVVSTNHVKVIISLNSTDELYMRKWDIYWNNNRSDRKYTIDIVDTFNNACNVDGCILRVFKFYKNANEIDESAKTTVFQLQYTKWLDSCGIVMQDIVSLCRIKNMLLHNPSELLEDLRKGNCKDTEKYSNKAWVKESLVSKQNDPLDPLRQSPLLVHCSAGCGRTGVFITLDFILNVLTEPTNLKNSIDVWNMDEDLIFITVNELRKQRISMVQNLTQYITCYESLLEYFAIQKRKVNGSLKQ